MIVQEEVISKPTKALVRPRLDLALTFRPSFSNLLPTPEVPITGAGEEDVVESIEHPPGQQAGHRVSVPTKKLAPIQLSKS